MQDAFRHRHHALGSKADVFALASSLRSALANPGDLQRIADEHHPADIADAMHHLSDEEDLKLFSSLSDHEKAEVLDEVDDTTLKRLVMALSHAEIANIVPNLAADEAADVMGVMPPAEWEGVLAHLKDPKAIRDLLAYAPDSAGGLMSMGYAAVQASSTVGAALGAFRAQKEVEPIFYVYAVDGLGHLVGQLDLWTLLTQDEDKRIEDVVDREVVSVTADMPQAQVALVFTRYDLTALPVTGEGDVLLGVITADDIIDVINEETAADIAHFSGTDAHELEKKSPVQIAMMRMPWIMATMVIELFAGIMVKVFDRTLAEVLLLASFMPIISAISGNTGLQSAAIIIRGLSCGQIELAHWKHAVLRQMSTTVILAAACGLGIGVVGTVWYGKWQFGALVAVGMFCSINIAGAVGTAIPLLSKRLGFDPALTAGPFETAFQDVIGISIFLGMATLLMPFIK